MEFEFKQAGTKKGKLKVEERNGKTYFSFDIITDLLYRMGDERDNTVCLLCNGKWETFTTGLKSTLKDAKLDLVILENNNKRSHYILTVQIDQAIASGIDARAEGMVIC